MGVGHRVIAIATKGMTAANALGGQPAAFYRPVFFKRFQCVGRASRLITTVKANPGAEYQPVSAYGQSDDMGYRVHEGEIGALAEGCNASRVTREIGTQS